MNTCTRCGGQFPTRTSGIEPGATLCLDADQCEANRRAAILKTNYVTLPMVRTDEQPAVAARVVYRLPDEVSKAIGLGCSTSRWLFEAKHVQPVVVCEKAENGALYALHVHEGR
jgi:hypothetical protein